MQVSHVNEHVTHAVIGGGQAIDFGISNSAEFFNILSSTLYKDQILAVVREVMCNANDAHIEAKVDRPFEVTLTNDKFIIRDFGTGIHNDDIGPIYATYGASTKKNDGTQTGGFGLGCKAPFAYTDHFEVNSYHDGTRTIYNLSKSSAQAMGKPSIVPIASFNTTESGLQVSIGIKNTTDYMKFKNLVTRIARNGDMNVLLNGALISKLGFDTTKSNYMVTQERNLLDQYHSIMIRYGNVIYPVELSNEIHGEFNAISVHLAKLSKAALYNYAVIFQAPPHSISVTPSREALSMQAHTINTLKSLFGDFLKQINGPFLSECTDYAADVIRTAVAEKEIPKLLNRIVALPHKEDHQFSKSIFDLKTMAYCFMRGNYPEDLEFRKKDITHRLTSMVAEKLLDRGLVQTYLRAMQDVDINYQGRSTWGSDPTLWLQRNVIAPILAKMQAKKIDHNRLYVFDQDDKNAPKNSYRADRPPLVEATSAKPAHLFACLPYLRKIVVLATSRVELQHKFMKHEVAGKLGNFDGFLFYHVSMKKGARDEALQFFTDLGMNIVDLTIRQTWERLAAPVVSVPRKPVKKGLAKVSSMYNPNTKGISTYLSRQDTAERIETPEYMLDVPVNKDTNTAQIGFLDHTGSLYFVQLHGDVGGVITNSAMYTKWKEKGVKDFLLYFQETLCEEIMTNPRIQEYWAFNHERVSGVDYNFLKYLYNSEVFRTQFGLVNNLTETDKKYLYLWEQLLTRRRYDDLPPVKAVCAYLAAIPLDPANDTLTSKLKGNPLIHMINESGVVKLLKQHPVGSKEAKNIIDVLTIVINNP